MTPAEERGAIAKALDTIGTVGALTVRGFDAAPESPTAGSAWPVLREFSAGTLAGGLAHSYDVYVIVRGSSPRIAAEDAENLAEPLVDALHPLGEWTQPGDTQMVEVAPGQVMPALRLRITPYL